MNVTCSATPCPVILNATCVFYEGANLVYTGINNNDNLQTALEKIDAKFGDAAIGYIFNNGVIQNNPGDPVQLGGSLIQNTIINSAGFNFTFTGQTPAEASTTFGITVERQDSGTASGQDCALVVTDTPVTAGTSATTPTYAMTSSGTATNNPAGSSVMFRIREAQVVGGFDQYGMMGFFGM